MTLANAEIAGAVFSALASFFLFLIARRMGFFVPLRQTQNPAVLPTLLIVILAFAIYILTNFTLYMVFIRWLVNVGANNQIHKSVWFSFFTSAFCFAAIIGYMQTLYRPVLINLWKRTERFHIQKDILIALTGCAIAFPLVTLTGQTLDWLTVRLFNAVTLPDQSAVLFIKLTIGKPLYFTLASLSVICFVPVVEEILFRAFLQSWLLRYCSTRTAISVASILFALFHYSASQGIGNISIIISLFILSLFLGYIYERQGSLLSPIVFHAAFNALSIANIYFFNANFG
jgi:membrane protease YdiL (CAAX protease family)